MAQARPVPEDGMGQGFWTDLRWSWRYRRCARRTVDWEVAAPSLLADRPDLLRFANWPYAQSTVDQQKWVVLERAWAGWPDPPRYVFLAFDLAGVVWAARDFHDWPQAWTLLEDRR